MRSTAIKVIVYLGLLFAMPVPEVVAADLESFQSLCKSIGFKSGTVDFGECVLELDRRTKAARQSEQTKEVVGGRDNPAGSRVTGDGTPDSATCIEYGFTPKTDGYGNCRLQLNRARLDYETELKRYQEKLAQYQAQEAEAQRLEQERQRKLRAQYSFCIADCSSQPGATLLGCMSYCGSQISGVGATSRPSPPEEPSRVRNYFINGRMVTCVTAGSLVSCR